jgi:hypothetical protein
MEAHTLQTFNADLMQPIVFNVQGISEGSFTLRQRRGQKQREQGREREGCISISFACKKCPRFISLTFLLLHLVFRVRTFVRACACAYVRVRACVHACVRALTANMWALS